MSEIYILKFYWNSPIKFNLQFDTWKECAMAALDTSQKYLNLEDEKIINKYRLATKFSCEAIEET